MVAWLVYYPAYYVLICKFHGYMISNLAQYLADKHWDIDLKRRRAIAREYSNQ
jgi:hypothetical protein